VVAKRNGSCPARILNKCDAGWVVTELGRQPWIIYGVMRTQEAVTPMPKIAIPFVIFTLIYVFLSVALVFLLRRQFMKTDELGVAG
jgi:cytochrome d ubiquinol oxidase subunit I